MHSWDRAFKECNVWVDVRLAHALRRRSGFLIGTRPGLNFTVAYLSPPGFVTIGEEQMHLHAHSAPLRNSMKQLYPTLDALVALTEGDKREYEELLGDDAAPVRLASIPNTARAMGGPKADLDARIVLAAGRLTPQKGFDLLIRAWAQVAAAQPDWRLRICGGGDKEEKLRQLVSDEGLAHVIELPGRRDLEEEMAKASIFVLSSRFEGFPLVLLEAMSKGMAVVSFDCPTGPGEVIDDHRNGMLVPARDVDALAAGIIELIEDGDLRRRLGPAAVETAREYSIDAVGPRWEDLFAELAESRGRLGPRVTGRSKTGS
jgi:glycosyltransferase involved in cell wall biosynthesis